MKYFFIMLTCLLVNICFAQSYEEIQILSPLESCTYLEATKRGGIICTPTAEFIKDTAAWLPLDMVMLLHRDFFNGADNCLYFWVSEFIILDSRRIIQVKEYPVNGSAIYERKFSVWTKKTPKK